MRNHSLYPQCRSVDMARRPQLYVIKRQDRKPRHEPQQKSEDQTSKKFLWKMIQTYTSFTFCFFCQNGQTNLGPRIISSNHPFPGIDSKAVQTQVLVAYFRSYPGSNMLLLCFCTLLQRHFLSPYQARFEDRYEQQSMANRGVLCCTSKRNLQLIDGIWPRPIYSKILFG